MNCPTSDKKAKKQNHATSYQLVESDKEPHDTETPEDMQIIIKTDKHSKQRSVKHDVYETANDHDSFKPAL